MIAGASSKLAVTFFRFVSVGGVGVLVNQGVLHLLYGQLRLPLVASSICATEIAIVGNYIGNEMHTYRHRQLNARRFLRFNGTALVGMVITVTALWTFRTFTSLPLAVANLGAIGLATAWNFTISSLWSFRCDLSHSGGVEAPVVRTDHGGSVTNGGSWDYDVSRQ